MQKIFTFLFLFSISLIIMPKETLANFTMEMSYPDARFSEKDLVKVYPNPMISESTIKINEELNLESNKVSIVFYNLVGSEVFKINQIKDYEQKISKEVFKNSGIYFYQLKVDEKIITTGRITVK